MPLPPTSARFADLDLKIDTMVYDLNDDGLKSALIGPDYLDPMDLESLRELSWVLVKRLKKLDGVFDRFDDDSKEARERREMEDKAEGSKTGKK